jgi:hypothetical protein
MSGIVPHYRATLQIQRSIDIELSFFRKLNSFSPALLFDLGGMQRDSEHRSNVPKAATS